MAKAEQLQALVSRFKIAAHGAAGAEATSASGSRKGKLQKSAAVSAA